MVFDNRTSTRLYEEQRRFTYCHRPNSTACTVRLFEILASSSPVLQLMHDSLLSFSLTIERRYPHAQYHLDPAKNKLSIKLVDPPITIPWIPVDPAAFNYDTFPRSQCARPMVVTLEAGDTLYLPALWFHRVAQDVGPSPDRIGVPMAIAVNHWFDMEYSSPLFALSSSLRKLTLALDGIQEDEL